MENKANKASLLTEEDIQYLRSKLANVSSLSKTDRQAQSSKKRLVSYYVR
ncbi:hypothetical protein TEPIDINF_001371 [Tepidibacillus infernus]